MSIAAVAALVGLVVLGVWYVGHHLDRPWIKTRIVAFAKDDLALLIDYDGLDLSLTSGLRARSLRLLTPPELASYAADFVRIEDLSLSARLWAFALGERSIGSLDVGSIDVAVVRDASGRDSISLAFPPKPEAPEAAPLSRSLAELPELALRSLDVHRVSARWIELAADGSRRTTSLSPLRARGAVQLAPHSLAGTDVAISGAPLRVELTEADRSQHADVGLELGVRASLAESLALRLTVDLREQDVLPGFAGTPRLIELAATVSFDEAAGKTTLGVDTLHALGDVLALAARADVFDGKPARIAASGTADAAISALPVPVEGLSVDGLRLRLAAKELTWDGTRLSGNLDYEGGLRGLALERPEGDVRLKYVTLLGQGSFAPAGGHFRAKLEAASVASESPAGSGTLARVSLDVDGTTVDTAGAQQVDGRAVLAIDGARATLPGTGRVDLGTTRLSARARGSAAELASRLVQRFESDLAIGTLDVTQPGRRTLLEGLMATCSIDRLALDAPTEFGVSGDAAVTLSWPKLRIFEGARDTGRKPVGMPAIAVEGAALHGTFPLSLARAGGTLTLARVDAPPSQLEDVALDLALDAPLAWAPERDLAAGATLSGHVGRFDASASRGALDALRVVTRKLAGGRYRLELDATGSALNVGGVPLPGALTAELRADAAPGAGTFTATTAVRGARGARLDMDLDASFERKTERLSYRAGLSANELGAFAGAVAQVAPGSKGLALGGARLRASAQGDFLGLLRATDGPLPAPVEHPLGTLRGAQSAELELEGLDYRGSAQAVVIPKLAVTIGSKHEAGGGGNATAELRLPSLQLEGGGSSLHLEALTQKLVATFDRSPEQGSTLIHASMELGSATQSWVPGLPVRDLRLLSDVQVDRLRSIFLRALQLDNPASGSTLRATGTLELLARALPGSTRTIAAREALSFEGRLVQKLETFEHLGLASHASGTLEVPFRLESGGLLGYRLLAALEAKKISFVQKDGGLAIENANGVVPIIEEFALLESGPVLSAGPRTSPLSDTRFFDVHPFLSGNDYVTLDSVRFGNMQPFGPVAANVRIERSDFLIDQLQAGYQRGQIVGQVRVAWRDGDPIVRWRLNATGLRSGKSQDVFDANAALSFVPRAMTLDGKVQIVRASREHVDDILDVLDPFHESANANRVRQALALGYPKFVRFALHDGAIDTKVELGGIAQLVRIDEIKAVPLGPILQKYVAPSLAGYLGPAPAKAPMAAPGETAAGARPLEAGSREAGAAEESSLAGASTHGEPTGAASSSEASAAPAAHEADARSQKPGARARAPRKIER
jgi:translocation and assembly module TamB